MNKKATYIRVEFDDGQVLESEKGEDAAAIFEWWSFAGVMFVIHGAKWNGPNLKETRPPHSPPVQPTPQPEAWGES